jgi:hypothetical protein
VTYAGVGLGLLVRFGGLVAVRDDTALVGALEAAGTVAAAVFAAVAAVAASARLAAATLDLDLGLPDTADASTEVTLV